MRKAILILTAILIFALGAVTALLTTQLPAAGAIPLRKKYRTYRIDFKDKRCEFCGENAAKYYEFSARADGAADSEYLCTECHRFLRYKTFTGKRTNDK